MKATHSFPPMGASWHIFPPERGRTRSMFGHIPDRERRKPYRWMGVWS